MNLNSAQRIMRACFMADVPVMLTGHRGIGKTEGTVQVAKTWTDPWGTNGIPSLALYCATQDVPDLSGFPVKVWALSRMPVVNGVPPQTPEDYIVTTWALPEWADVIQRHCAPLDKQDEEVILQMRERGEKEEVIWAFEHRPKYIVFLDELKRAPREVTQAMYPFVLEKRLHMTTLPKGVRVVAADNYAGAYDVRELDDAFNSRWCHIDVEADPNLWNEWAIKNGIYPKVRNFVMANPTFLLSVTTDQEAAKTVFDPLPDPRSWAFMSRLEFYGRIALQDESPEVQDLTIAQAQRGVMGLGAQVAYGKFEDSSITAADILEGYPGKDGKTEYPDLKKLLHDSTDGAKTLLQQKLHIEMIELLKGRKYDVAEAKRLIQFLVDIDARDRVVAIVQELYTQANKKPAAIALNWAEVVVRDPKILEMMSHLLTKRGL